MRRDSSCAGERPPATELSLPEVDQLSTFSTLLYEREGPVAYVALNRPEALNAMNRQLTDELLEAVRMAGRDRTVRVFVLTTRLDRAFSVGADLKERATLSEAETIGARQSLVEAFDAVGRLEKPTICAVKGFALGGGLELALQCDLILCADNAVFGLPEVTIGIIPGGGGTQALPRRIPTALAKELIFTGARIDAARAAQIGLVNRVVSLGELPAVVQGLAGQIGQNSPLAVRQAKRAIDCGLNCDYATGKQFEIEAYHACLKGKDRLEGLRAFAEKRKPIFQDLP